MTELHLKYRPQTFKDVIGQPEACKVLNDLGKRGETPHALLLTGGSGTGKTTIARILARKLKCDMKYDFFEMNGADKSKIEDMRWLIRHAAASPLRGPCRIWLIDECSRISGDGQECLLKLLEDYPSTTYFFLCTTDPQKLKRAIQTRCTEIRCKPISEKDLILLVNSVSEKEGLKCFPSVAKAIAESSGGSARQAVKLLNSVIGLVDEKEQLAVINNQSTEQSPSQFIGRLLMNPKSTWKEYQAALAEIDDASAEGIRIGVARYMQAVLLKSGQDRAGIVMEEFVDPIFSSAGLVYACWRIVKGL